VKIIRVIIFEDNTNLRRGLATLINGTSGFECAGAFANCNHIVDDINETKPDVILMDIEMPGISGIEAVLLIREKFPAIKILMETIFEDDEKIFNSICAGAQGYILKNTPPSQILESIREIYEGGAPMTPIIASRVLTMVKSKPLSPVKKSFDLSDRENEILKCLVEGMSYKMIADNCFISIDTVSSHVKNIYKKLQVHSKGEAISKAIKRNIV
jgi:DNA-binding NarL/FixJ family response regulator